VMERKIQMRSFLIQSLSIISSHDIEAIDRRTCDDASFVGELQPRGSHGYSSDF